MRLLISLLLLGSLSASELPVFPGAIGFGTDTPAGRGGQILRVTNLDPSGPGSLRAALEAPGPRTVIFEVAGVIDLAGSTLRIKDPFITVAGASAPDPGITLIRGQLLVESHDVLIRHLAFRPGDGMGGGFEPDGMSIGTGDVHHVVVDHCSATWGIDENLSISSEPPYPSRITLSNCLIAEGLSESVHAKGEHSKGSLIAHGSSEISLIRNLYAHNYERSPRLGGDTTVVLLNNLIYNPGYSAVSALYKAERANPVLVLQGNHCIRGPDSRDYIGLMAPAEGPSHIWWRDNLCQGSDGSPAPLLVPGQHSASSGLIVELDEPPLWPGTIRALPAAHTEALVLSNAGARPLARDPIDARIIASVSTRAGLIIDSQDDVGGYPDHAPVYRAAVLPADPQGDADADGYTNLEEWLHAQHLALLPDITPPQAPEGLLARTR